MESFCETFGIEENQSLKKDEHYQLSGSKNQRIHNNTEKISNVFTTMKYLSMKVKMSSMC